MTRLNAWSPTVLSVLRLITALLFIEHGAMKLLHFPAPMPEPPGPMPPLILVAAWLELVGGGLLAVGLLTRPVAFLLSGEMAVAYFMAHAPHSFYPVINMGEAAVLYCFVFLYLVFAGPGRWSLDTLLIRDRS
ncbi:MAG TPA: DoxX family protein [Caulobacteraceae bacterium]